MSTSPAPASPALPEWLLDDAPLLRAWTRFMAAADSGAVTPFTVPGHKQRTDLVGDVVRGDAPLYGALAPVKDGAALLTDAEARAARLWGADWCRFSVQGSTHGNQALALAVGRPGSSVVVSRALHRSLLLGIVLAGLRPVWVRPALDPASGLPTTVPVADVRAALEATPDACAVMLGEPTYVGTVGDVAGHAAAAHEAGVPLIVDAAWAAHFGFHPDLPPHALALGADALVTSAHKLLPAYSQGALVLARTRESGGLLERRRLDRGFDATMTTSPTGSILASVDAARALLEHDGERLCGRLLDGVRLLRERVAGVPGLTMLQGPLPDGTPLDPTKIVLLLPGSGADGLAVERELIAAGYPVEMAERDLLVVIASVADDTATLARFADALVAAVERSRGDTRPLLPAAAWSVEPVAALTPREAFFAEHERVPSDRAVGRVCGELVAPYPPGIPVLAPGELVTVEALTALRDAAAAGARIAYAADPSLETIEVVARP